MLVKVRMLTSIAGSIEARSGEIVQCDRALAARLVASGQAEPVTPASGSSASEATMAAAPETAAKPRARARRKRGAKRGGLG